MLESHLRISIFQYSVVRAARSGSWRWQSDGSEQMKTVDLRSAKNTLADLAYQYILDALLSHELKPGDRLRAEDLANAMGISLTPVRQALAKLSGEGLVEFRGVQGPFVASPTDDEIEELYDSRLMCELYCIQEGIQNADAEFLKEAARLMAEWDAAYSAADGTHESYVRIAEADAKFHAHLLTLWPNRRTQAWYRQSNVHIKAVRLRAMFENNAGAPPQVADRRAEHQALYEALERRDADTACKVLRQHVARSREVLKGMRRSQPETA